MRIELKSPQSVGDKCHGVTTQDIDATLAANDIYLKDHPIDTWELDPQSNSDVPALRGGITTVGDTPTLDVLFDYSGKPTLEPDYNGQ